MAQLLVAAAPKPRARISLRTVIVVVGLITAMVPAAVLGLTSNLSIRSLIITDSMDRYQHLAQSLAGNLDEFLVDRERILTNVADMLGAVPFDSASATRIMGKTVKNFPEVNRLAVTDVNGRIVNLSPKVTDGRQLIGTQLPAATFSLVKTIFKLRRAVIAPEVRVGAASHKHILVMGTPIFGDDGSLRGALLAVIWTSNIEAYVKQLWQDETGQVIIATTSGQVIARKGFLPRDQRDDLASTPIWKVVNAQQTGVFHRQLKGEERVGAFATVSITGWKVWSSVTRRELDKDIYDAFRAGSIWLCIAILLAFLIALVLGRWLTRPINAVRVTAAAIADGHLDQRAPEGVLSEFAALARAINSMASALQKNLNAERTAKGELEVAVAERTSELLAENLERRRAEDDLRRSTETVSAILDASPVAIIAFDSDLKVSSWNRAAEAMFGYQAEDIVGGPPPQITEDQEVEFRELFDEAVHATAPLIGYQTKRRHMNGTILDVRISRMPLHDGAGAVSGVVFAIEDETVRRRTEEQLRQSQKMEAIGNLTGGIAHDFNNLLAIIVGNLDLIEMRVRDDEKVRDRVQIALKASTRGAELTRQLLAFSRRQSLEPKVVSVNDLVRNVIKLLGHTLGENVEIRLVEDSDIWPVLIDPAQLDSAIVNLAVNARDAMPDGGTLTIVTSNTSVNEEFAATRPDLALGDYVKIEIADTGTGMPAEVLDHIFEPFFTTKGATKGTGLGLSMVYGFVKQSGGHVTVYSEPGVGTTFRVYLPRTSEAASARAALAQTSPQGAQGGESVLVVEDNDTIRETVQAQLLQLGYRVFTAPNAEDALVILEGEEPIDLVFSDVIMPGKTGIVLAREIVDRWPGKKVLLTSGFSATALDNERDGLNVAILNKPYRAADLARRVRQLLDT